MKDPIALIDIILDTYDRLDFHPNPDGSTHCNEAVNAVCQAFGYKGLAGMMADQIVELIEAESQLFNGLWSEVAMDKAQDMANQGSLLVAGLDSKALSQSHGHVVVIRPGKAVFSGKWGQCPRVLNIGAHDFIARGQNGSMTNQPVGLNEAFIPLPKIWVLRSTL